MMTRTDRAFQILWGVLIAFWVLFLCADIKVGKYRWDGVPLDVLMIGLNIAGMYYRTRNKTISG